MRKRLDVLTMSPMCSLHNNTATIPSNHGHFRINDFAKSRRRSFAGNGLRTDATVELKTAASSSRQQRRSRVASTKALGQLMYYEICIYIAKAIHRIGAGIGWQLCYASKTCKYREKYISV